MNEFRLEVTESSIDRWLREFQRKHDELRSIGPDELRELAYALHDDIPMGYEASMRLADWLLHVTPMPNGETCHDNGGTDENDQQVFECDACGCVLSLYDRDGMNTLCTSFVFDYPRYCPECGRRIVEPTTNDVDVEV